MMYKRSLLFLFLSSFIFSSCGENLKTLNSQVVIEETPGELEKILQDEEDALKEDLGEPQFFPEDFIFPESSLINILSDKYSHLDPQGIVPKSLLDRAIKFFDLNQKRIPNKSFIVVIDFLPHSGKSRMFIINMKTGAVEKLFTAHGVGSDTDNDGLATVFSNTPDSRQSSLGIYMTAETYFGKHGYSLRLDGMESTNSNVRKRAIVIHGADYVSSDKDKMGRSWGCPAIDHAIKERVINQIKNGAVMIAGLSN